MAILSTSCSLFEDTDSLNSSQSQENGNEPEDVKMYEEVDDIPIEADDEPGLFVKLVKAS